MLTEALNSYTEGKGCLLYTVSTNTLHAQIFCLKSGPWQSPDIRVSLFTPSLIVAVYGELISNSSAKIYISRTSTGLKSGALKNAYLNAPNFERVLLLWQQSVVFRIPHFDSAMYRIDTEVFSCKDSAKSRLIIAMVLPTLLYNCTSPPSRDRIISNPEKQNRK
jgi:hypothetical protein